MAKTTAVCTNKIVAQIELHLKREEIIGIESISYIFESKLNQNYLVLHAAVMLTCSPPFSIITKLK